jgi:hypothetical protein
MPIALDIAGEAEHAAQETGCEQGLGVPQS